MMRVKEFLRMRGYAGDHSGFDGDAHFCGTLKPCPFCGREAILSLVYEKDVTHRTPQAVWSITIRHHKNCFLAARMNGGKRFTTVSSLNKRKLIESWNMRGNDWDWRTSKEAKDD